MSLRTLLAAGVAASLAATPVIAQAATAAVPARNSAEISDAEHMRGGFIIPVIAIIAIILGILAMTGGDDGPESP